MAADYVGKQSSHLVNYFQHNHEDQLFRVLWDLLFITANVLRKFLKNLASIYRSCLCLVGVREEKCLCGRCMLITVLVEYCGQCMLERVHLASIVAMNIDFIFYRINGPLTSP